MRALPSARSTSISLVLALIALAPQAHGQVDQINRLSALPDKTSTHAIAQPTDPVTAAMPAPISVARISNLRSKANIGKERKISPLVHGALGPSRATFIENRGQFDAHVKFQMRQGGRTAWVTNKGIVFDFLRQADVSSDVKDSRLNKKVKRSVDDFALDRGSLGRKTGLANQHAQASPLNTSQRIVFNEELMSADLGTIIEPGKQYPGLYNYFIGNDPTKWRSGVKGYSEVVYRNAWPGVDFRVAGNGPNLEQEFIVSPGADLSKIRVAYRGIDKLETSADGSLVVQTAFGRLRESKPLIYQEIAGKRVPVNGRFTLVSSTAYSFEVGTHNPQYAMVIDPTLLYSTYLGGSGSDRGNGIAVDSSGSAYIVGTSYSTNFPTTVGAFQTSAVAVNAFVSKIDPLGNELVYSTFLGSAYGKGIAVDSMGDAYVVGGMILGLGFPSTPSAYSSCGLGYEATFVTKLNTTGDGLLYSSCFGAEATEAISFYGVGGYAIAVDASGTAYITGTSGGGFPATPNAFQPVTTGGRIPIVAAINPALQGNAQLVYSTYLGNSNWNDDSYAIAVDSADDMYVTGGTFDRNFPVTPGALQTSLVGTSQCQVDYKPNNVCETAFVSKLDPKLAGAASLVYSSFLGGTSGSIGIGIAVDSSGSAYVAGQTGQPINDDTIPFPTTPGAFETTVTGGFDAFVTKFTPDGSGLMYSTILGNDQDGATGIALDSLNEAYVVGSTRSSNFPVTSDAYQSTNEGGGGYGFDTFITKLNATGSAQIYSSLLGGSGDDYGLGIAVDSNGDAYMTGEASSVDFPTTPTAFQVINGGGNCEYEPACSDAFISKFALGTLNGLTITGLTPDMGGNAGQVTTTIVGGGFEQGATVTLACPDQANVVGTNVTVSADGRTLTVTFNLVGVNAEGCNVVITNPDGTTTSQVNGFVVEQGGAPDVRISVAGFPRLREGLGEPYYIVIENVGNVDSGLVRIWATFPNLLIWQSAGVEPGSSGSMNGNTFLAFDVSPKSRSFVTVPFLLKAPSDPGLAHTPFQILVWKTGK
jgi:Beta-propeller repeat